MSNRTNEPSGATHGAIYTLHRGSRPLLVSLPHVGTVIPDALRGRYVEHALGVEDTDWFLDRLYAFAADLGASLLVPRLSRYVIDLNRPSDNQPMYAGSNNTELCPTRAFTGDAIYRDGQAPDETEIRRRVATCWQPYHDALAAELARLQADHGHVVLFDGHSIKSELPWLFDGQLPHLNLGTVGGASCAPSLARLVVDVFAAQSTYSHVHNGRFKGGHITRRYGQPAQGVHALQLEMCWRAYMDEDPPYRWHDARAAGVTPLLRRMVEAMLTWTPGHA
jgi:N-formylglutamate deformylase